VAFKLEMMVLKVGEAVAHVLFTSPDLLFPDHLSIAQDSNCPCDVDEVAVNYKFRTQAALAKLRAGQVEVVGRSA
jgi:hypothetical protein